MRKLIQSFGTDAKRAKVYRDSDTREYVARLYYDGVLYASADYFTDSKDDALSTAEIMAGTPRNLGVA